jgi:hypothetical protein
MERIHYAGEELVTGSEIAEALMEYAAVLAQQRTAASVDIPVRHADGTIGTASLLLGPASQLVREPIEEPGKEVVDDSLVQRLRRLTAALAPKWPVAGSVGTTSQTTVDYDWTDEV